MSACLIRDEEPPSNEELVRRCQGGDLSAYGDLWLRLHLRVYRYCYRMLGEQTAAEDAMGDAFVKALKALPSFRAESFQNWLFTIAHNVIIDQVRRTRPSVSLDEAMHVPDDQPELGHVDEFEDIAALLARLSPLQQAVVALRLEGFVTNEIAVMIDKSPGSIDQAFYRAMVRLRELMERRLPTMRGESHE